MSDLTFSAGDGKFAARLGARQLRSLERFRTRAATLETGGILVGRYDARHRIAIIERVCGPPSDSRAGRAWFHRGVAGLQRLLDQLWRREEVHYLGEWHHHPAADTNPSGQDIAQLRSIASQSSYQCPEPLLLIIGNAVPIRDSVRVIVVRRKGKPVELERRT